MICFFFLPSTSSAQGYSDQCLIKWNLKLENERWDYDHQNKDLKLNDPYEECIRYEDFKRQQQVILPKRSHISKTI